MKTNWPLRTLDQLGEVKRGRSRHRPRDAAHLYGGPYPFIQTGDVKHSHLFINDYSQTYTEAGLAQSRLWREGTLCITIAANIADTAILGIDACFPDSIIGFIPDKKKADARFVKYLFDALLKKRFKQFTQGAAQDNLSQSKLLSLDFAVPVVGVQREIAEILSSYDDLIENNRRRIELLEQSARLLYKEWFVHLRFPGHEHVNITNGIPDGWERKPLSEIAEFRLGKMLDKKKNRGELMPYLGNKNVRWGEFDFDNIKEMRFEERELEKFGLKHGDIVMCEGGVPGRCAIWKEQVPGIMIQKALHRIRPHEGLDHRYLYHSLSYQGQTGRLAGLFTGATIKHLPREKLAKVEVDIPPTALAGRFIEQVTPIESQIDVLQSSTKRAAQARDLLLPRLMNGEIVV